MHHPISFEMLYYKLPSIGHLEPSGSDCYIHISEERRPLVNKPQPKAENAIFVESPSIYKVQLRNKHMFTVKASNCTFVQPQYPSAKADIAISNMAHIPTISCHPNLRI